MAYWMLGHTIEKDIVVVGLWPIKNLSKGHAQLSCKEYCRLHNEAPIKEYIMLDYDNWENKYRKWLKELRAHDIEGLVLSLQTSLMALKETYKKRVKTVQDEKVKNEMLKLIYNEPDSNVVIIF